MSSKNKQSLPAQKKQNKEPVVEDLTKVLAEIDKAEAAWRNEGNPN